MLCIFSILGIMIKFKKGTDTHILLLSGKSNTAFNIFLNKIPRIYLHSLIREHSSAGLEHLPYKQRVRGSNPCAPTG